MVMTAKLSSSLTRDRLAEDALADPKEMQAHGLKEDRGFLLFDSQHSKPSFFHRDRGIDLTTGEIHLGGVQFEASPVDRFVYTWRDGVAHNSIDSWGRGISRIPVLFEIERLFVGDLGRFEVTHMFADGRDMGQGITEREQKAFDAWYQEYRRAVEHSLMGRPVLEADFARRTTSRFGRRIDPRKLYGERVLEQLEDLSRSELRAKYLRQG